jgi:putative ABC transport system permease protein
MSLVSGIVKAVGANSRGILWPDSLRADFVLAGRRLRGSKVTSAAAILSLALGIGACQTVLPVAYTPFRRTDARGTMQGGTLVVRTSTSNPLALASILRHEIPRTSPEFRVGNMRTQQELIDSQTIRERLLAMLARFFGAVSLLLASLGLYGVLDYSVWQRRREIGIRMALGAGPRDLAVRVTARVFSMVLLGALTGLALGLASVRFVEPLLYQVRSTELPVLVIPSLAILGAAALAALPAVIRAVAIDPATLLRAE